MQKVIHAVLLLALMTVFLYTAHAQDPLKAFPNNYKQVLDNDDLTVIRVHYGPHEKIGVHDHSNYPTIYVYLNDSGEVRFTHDETPPFVMTRPAAKAGSFRIAPARPERHLVENLSDLPSDFLRIELKKTTLPTVQKPVRGAAPDPLKPGVTEEFKSPDLTLSRIVCDPTAPCLQSTPPNTLLVALTTFAIHADDPHSSIHTNLERQLQIGDVEWEQAAKKLTIRHAAGTPTQLLSITITHPQK